MSITWFRALTISGKDANLGFQCSVCGLLIQHSIYAAQGVPHCGRTDIAPRSYHGLETRRLGNRSNLPANMVLCFDTSGDDAPDEPQPPVEVGWI